MFWKHFSSPPFWCRKFSGPPPSNHPSPPLVIYERSLNCQDNQQEEEVGAVNVQQKKTPKTVATIWCSFKFRSLPKQWQVQATALSQLVLIGVIILDLQWSICYHIVWCSRFVRKFLNKHSNIEVLNSTCLPQRAYGYNGSKWKKLYFKINKIVFKNGKRFRSDRSSSDHLMIF